jgi:hypothetical protein
MQVIKLTLGAAVPLEIRTQDELADAGVVKQERDEDKHPLVGPETARPETKLPLHIGSRGSGGQLHRAPGCVQYEAIKFLIINVDERGLVECRGTDHAFHPHAEHDRADVEDPPLTLLPHLLLDVGLRVELEGERHRS